VLAVGHEDAVGQEEVRAQQHVHALERDVAEPQRRIPDLLVAELEAGEFPTPDVQLTVRGDAARIPGQDHAGVRGLDPRSRRRRRRQQRSGRAAVERHANPDPVEGGEGPGRLELFGVGLVIDHRLVLVGSPIGEIGVLASRRLEQANGAVAEVVFDVGGAEYVLTDVPVQILAQTPVEHDEVDATKGQAVEDEVLNPGHGDLGFAVTDAGDVHAEGGRFLPQVEPGHGRGGGRTEKGPGVDREEAVHAVDRGVHQGPRPAHRNLKVGKLGELAIGQGRSAQADAGEHNE
jgi:hypothetical protein